MSVETNIETYGQLISILDIDALEIIRDVAGREDGIDEPIVDVLNSLTELDFIEVYMKLEMQYNINIPDDIADMLETQEFRDSMYALDMQYNRDNKLNNLV